MVTASNYYFLWICQWQIYNSLLIAFGQKYCKIYFTWKCMCLWFQCLRITLYHFCQNQCGIILTIRMLKTDTHWREFSSRTSLFSCQMPLLQKSHCMAVLNSSKVSQTLNAVCALGLTAGTYFYEENYWGNWQNTMKVFRFDSSIILRLIPWFSSLYSETSY